MKSHKSKSSGAPAAKPACKAVPDIQPLLNSILNSDISLFKIEDASNKAATLLNLLSDLYSKELEGNYEGDKGGVYASGTISISGEVIESLMESTGKTMAWMQLLHQQASALNQTKGAA